MITFLIGLVILFVGGFLYSKFIVKVFQPDDRPTPAVAMADGVDFVVMPEWKNDLIELLNIAGTGPVLGPIQGILFGPIAFLTIPIGNVIAGSMHDYLAGMISMRHGGAQIPGLVKRYLGNGVHKVYLVILMVLMILVAAVFVYTPGDLLGSAILGIDVSATSPGIWIIYACIFAYYLIATLLPIDKIIGMIYPIFGAILLISAVGVFIGVVMDGGAGLNEIWEPLPAHIAMPDSSPFFPVFFITVACGILSGFHATQAALVSRTVKHEREGVRTFYWMMILEGFIAMCWAAGAMVLFNRQPELTNPLNATAMVSIVTTSFLGRVGSILAVLGVIVLPITSGDTAMRSVRLMFAEAMNIDQRPIGKRVFTAMLCFIPAVLILFWAKFNSQGFMLLWRYFAFTNQFVGCFALAMFTVYLAVHDKPVIISIVPLMFYTFIVMSYIFHAPIGFGIEGRLLGQPDNWVVSYILGAACAVAVAALSLRRAKMHKEELMKAELRPIG